MGNLNKLKDLIFEMDNKACFIERDRILTRLEKEMADYTSEDKYAIVLSKVLEEVSVPLEDCDYFAGRVVEALPYIERTAINRKLPDTLVIQVQECGQPLAVVQDDSVWLVSPKGKIVEQTDPLAAKNYGVIDGCQLLAPSVGTKIALATEYATQQSSLLELIAALEEAGELENVDAIHLGDLSMLTMDYIGRFTVQMPYEADYARKLRALRQIIDDSGAIQDNMTGTFDMRREDGKVNLIQNVR